MKCREYIRRVVSIPLYLVLLYYLLPFRPGHLYYLSHHASADILNEIKKEKEEQQYHTNSFNKCASLSHNSFTKKPKVKFFFRTGFTVASPLTSQFFFFVRDEERVFTHAAYRPPLVFFISNKGPPVV